MPEEVAQEEILVEEIEEEIEAGLPGCPFWMVTFGDVVSLLMTFFVLILSFSDTLPEHKGKIQLFFTAGGGEEITSGVEGQSGGGGAISDEDISGVKGSTEAERDFGYMQQEVDANALELEEKNDETIKYSIDEVSQYLKAASIAESVHVQKSQVQGGFSLKLDQNFAFVMGSERFRPESKNHLETIAKIISQLPNDLIISGFADDYNKIAFPLYKSNTHLAIARANQVAEFLINRWNIAPERISIKVKDNEKNSSENIAIGATVQAAISINLVSEFNGYKRSELRKYVSGKNK